MAYGGTTPYNRLLSHHLVIFQHYPGGICPVIFGSSIFAVGR